MDFHSEQLLLSKYCIPMRLPCPDRAPKSLECYSEADTGAYVPCNIDTNITNSLIFTIVGSFIIDKMWRRHLIFIGIGCIILIQTAITILSWQYVETESK